MSAAFTEDDVEKPVENANGEEIGTVATVEDGTAYVEPRSGVMDTIRSALGWTTGRDDAVPIREESVDEITDDAIRLAGETLDSIDAPASTPATDTEVDGTESERSTARPGLENADDGDEERDQERASAGERIPADDSATEPDRETDSTGDSDSVTESIEDSTRGANPEADPTPNPNPEPDEFDERASSDRSGGEPQESDGARGTEAGSSATEKSDSRESEGSIDERVRETESAGESDPDIRPAEDRETATLPAAESESTRKNGSDEETGGERDSADRRDRGGNSAEDEDAEGRDEVDRPDETEERDEAGNRNEIGGRDATDAEGGAERLNVVETNVSDRDDRSADRESAGPTDRGSETEVEPDGEVDQRADTAVGPRTVNRETNAEAENRDEDDGPDAEVGPEAIRGSDASSGGPEMESEDADGSDSESEPEMGRRIDESAIDEAQTREEDGDDRLDRDARRSSTTEEPFATQRAAIERGQRLFERSLAVQRSANRLALTAFEAQLSLQRQGIELVRSAIDSDASTTDETNAASRERRRDDVDEE